MDSYSSIDDLANNPDWQPALDNKVVRVFTTFAPYSDQPHTVVVKLLKNGVFYTEVFKNDEDRVLRNTTYNGDPTPESPKGYNIVNLVVSNDGGNQVTTTTFRYEFRKRKDLPTTWLDYTVWHSDVHTNGGITLLKSVEAVQEIEDGRLDI